MPFRSMLQPSDEVHCKQCQQWHAVECANSGEATAGNRYAFTTCTAGHYYVGTIGTPCLHPTRQPPIWTLKKDARTLECCLRSEGELGWVVELYRNGVMYGSRRFVLHAEALADAAEVKSECEREGWN